MAPAVAYELGGTSPEDVVDGVCRALGVGGVGSASRDDLLRVVRALAEMASGLLADAVGTTPGGVVAMRREDSDLLAWRANRDSGDSDLRPSGDAHRGGSGTRLKGHADDRARQRRGDDVGDRDGNGADAHGAGAGDRVGGARRPDGMPEGLTPEEAEDWSQSMALHDPAKGLRADTGRGPGRQPGAKGHGMSLPEGAERLEESYAVPAGCAGCPRLAECAAGVESGRLQNVVDVELRVVVRPVRRVDVDASACPLRGSRDDAGGHEADAPDDRADNGDPGQAPRTVALVSAAELAGDGAPEGEARPTMPVPGGTNLYGPGLVAQAACLYCVAMASFQRTRDLLAPMTGTTLSVGTVKSMVRSVAGLVSPAVDAIARVLREGGGVVNCDGTGVNVNGTNDWIHSACTSLYTFLSVQESRGAAGLDAAGFLMHFAGTVVHDCWAAYWRYDAVTHALCNAHLLRELEALRKWFAGCGEWALRMSDLLLLMRDTRDEYLAAGHGSLPANVLGALRSLYEETVEMGLAACPEPVREGGRGRPRQGKARSLLLRMKKREDCFLRFLEDFSVPFTNNLAERSFRLVARKKGSAGCFRTLEGARDFCAIWSYLSTARKQGHSYWDAALAAATGRAMALIFPDGVDSAVEAQVARGSKSAA